MSLTRLLLRAVLGRRLPVTTGELRVGGPSAPVTIRRDKWGVPHVDAAMDDIENAIGASVEGRTLRELVAGEPPDSGAGVKPFETSVTGPRGQERKV